MLPILTFPEFLLKINIKLWTKSAVLVSQILLLNWSPPSKLSRYGHTTTPLLFMAQRWEMKAVKIISTGSSVKGKKMRTKQGLSFTKRVTDFVTDRASITKDFGSGDFFSYSWSKNVCTVHCAGTSNCICFIIGDQFLFFAFFLPQRTLYRFNESLRSVLHIDPVPHAPSKAFYIYSPRN